MQQKARSSSSDLLRLQKEAKSTHSAASRWYLSNKNIKKHHWSTPATQQRGHFTSPLSPQLFQSVSVSSTSSTSDAYTNSLFNGYLSSFLLVNSTAIHSTNPPPHIKRLHQPKFQDYIEGGSLSMDPCLFIQPDRTRNGQHGATYYPSTALAPL